MRPYIFFLALAACAGQSTDTTTKERLLPNDPSQGPPGEDGIHCWDLNADGSTDSAEDVNGDGAFDTLDCRGSDGIDGTDGATGSPGVDGTGGADGAQGPPGADGAQGPPGADGVDGALGAGLTKADLYTVEVTTGSPSRAFCDDVNDVLITGGCWVGPPGMEYSRPVDAADPAVQSGWECFASGGSTSTATAVCLSVL